MAAFEIGLWFDAHELNDWTPSDQTWRVDPIHEQFLSREVHHGELTRLKPVRVSVHAAWASDPSLDVVAGFDGKGWVLALLQFAIKGLLFFADRSDGDRSNRRIDP